MKKVFFVILVLLYPLSAYSQGYYDEYGEEYYSDEYYDEYGEEYSEEYYDDEYYDPEYTEESVPEPVVASTVPKAEEKKFPRSVSLGFGLEFNGLLEHLDGFQAGGFMHLDFRFIKLMALGLKVSYVQDISNTATLNYNVRNIAGAGLLARFYFAEAKAVEFFAQVEGGVTVNWLSGYVVYEKFGKVDLGFWAGAEVGTRINVNKVFYIEPFAGGGYPFVWAAGVAFGFKFESKKPQEK